MIIFHGGPDEIQATQPFSKRLVEDYGYHKSGIQTRPQLKVKSSPSDPDSYPVDIAVFENRGKVNQKLKMIVECKFLLILRSLILRIGGER